MNYRLKNLLILIIMITFLAIIYIMPVKCLFKEITGISCISCGMTRAFYFILAGDLISASYTNILSIPLFIFLSYSFFYLIIDIIRDKNDYINFVLNFLSKYWIFVFLTLIISFIYNLFINSV